MFSNSPLSQLLLTLRLSKNQLISKKIFKTCQIMFPNDLNMQKKKQKFQETTLFWVLFVTTRTTDTQWRHKSEKSESLGQCGRQNILKIWDWDLIFGCAVKEISSPGVRSPCVSTRQVETQTESNFDHWSVYQNSTINLPIYSFGPETFFMSVYVLLYYIELHTNTQSKRSIHFLWRYSKHFILHLCGT